MLWRRLLDLPCRAVLGDERAEGDPGRRRWRLHFDHRSVAEDGEMGRLMSTRTGADQQRARRNSAIAKDC